ncbi:hypothetical protein GCM10010215_48290 [Streptomyces virginiae]|uniref:Uncharacterized protein n=2 Tax=Streptomyces virginiae TaxID=1961 RepID=A0ABQ3NXG5_STRVG|nr:MULTISPECIES: hypothetical protein [Streptomyces]KOV15521.1 hypothetical protein ADK91_06405 [Streptomyces sp. XY511]MBP2348886.1 hypothetical protein [Streptomyces virginiae]MCI4085588.1 hypothetical protein [Streptomyces sp. MMS21 TC-5]GGQ17825.1 hypothetical protein GCM10010215_48290 [Streptomyces virginiae]GHI17463.1 hypothetical protein Scinn_69260 [Streptomyces virginiae]
MGRGGFKPKLLTEMLKGTSEGVILASLASRPAYGVLENRSFLADRLDQLREGVPSLRQHASGRLARGSDAATA